MSSQAFDEDLHIETVGGAARFVRLNHELDVERSNSAVVSFNMDKFTDTRQLNLVVEGFYTHLDNPFILSDAEELDNGVSVVTKRNGDGATISGLNLEANLAPSDEWVIWREVRCKRHFMTLKRRFGLQKKQAINLNLETLRTPNTYGYCSLVFSPSQDFSVAYSGVLTGSMDVAHVIDPDTEQTVIKSTPEFFEHNIKFNYSMSTEDDKLEFSAGVKNIFNSYQQDFDLGADRDAGYVYGPLRPRTVFVGVKFGLN